ncbi:hypothetical protein BJV77DRAFT_1003374 [Russula vinacea]|nr:hypothetical protein BJV77DRAFT_1003374 [Russula vinacea]
MVNVVIREVVKNIWTFSTPFTRLGLFRIGGRSTAIRLASGDVWVLASTPLTVETKATIDRLGPVKFLVGPDSVHHLFLAEFHEAYPNARLLSVEEVIKKKRNDNLKWHGYWSDSNREPNFGFENEIKSCYFSGFKNKDVAFLHAPSKTLMVADLIFNLPAMEQYSESWMGSGFPVISQFVRLNPYTTIHRSVTKALVTDATAMSRDAKSVASWNFHRIIPCHGDVIEVDGDKAWQAAYGMFLD